MSSAADISYISELTKIKSIEVTTTDKEGFAQMSAMVSEIEKVVRNYPADFNVSYRFK